jgi:hypothetical protein
MRVRRTLRCHLAATLTRSGSDGKRFVVRADEKLTAFVELESAICACGELL